MIPFGGQTITHFTVREKRGIRDTQPIIDNLAPLFHVRSDSPPLQLITRERDLEWLGRYEENAYLWRMMKVAGHKETKLYEMDGHDYVAMTQPTFGLLLNQIRRVVGLKKND